MQNTFLRKTVQPVCTCCGSIAWHNHKLQFSPQTLNKQTQRTCVHSSLYSKDWGNTVLHEVVFCCVCSDFTYLVSRKVFVHFSSSPLVLFWWLGFVVGVWRLTLVVILFISHFPFFAVNIRACLTLTIIIT